METKELKIIIPEGYEIDEENSTFECVKFKKIHQVNTWEDLQEIGGYYIDTYSNLNYVTKELTNISNRNIFYSEKYAKSALALAQISQLMPYYGGIVTNKDWKNYDKTKYGIVINQGSVSCGRYNDIRVPIAFHTKEQLLKFISFPENVQLVKDFYMID